MGFMMNVKDDIMLESGKNWVSVLMLILCELCISLSPKSISSVDIELLYSAIFLFICSSNFIKLKLFVILYQLNDFLKENPKIPVVIYSHNH